MKNITQVHQGHTLLDRLSGADAAGLTQAVAKHATTPLYNPLSRTDNLPAKASTVVPPGLGEQEESTEKVNDRLRKLMNQSNVVLFMKGSPEAPRCGFFAQNIGVAEGKGCCVHVLRYPHR